MDGISKETVIDREGNEVEQDSFNSRVHHGRLRRAG